MSRTYPKSAAGAIPPDSAGPIHRVPQRTQRRCRHLAGGTRPARHVVARSYAMVEHLRPDGTGLGQALGRIPSGLYILTVRSGDRATGMLASWVQQAGFDPPMLTVAVRRDREVADLIDATGRFTLSQLAKGSKSLIRHFGRGFAPDAAAFEGLDL